MNPGLSPMLVACITLVALAGCGTSPPVKSFLGASYPAVTYREIQPRSAPLRLHLAVEFQRNGEPFPKGDVPLKDYANRILVNSRVITPVEEGGEGEIRIVLNNIADPETVAVETAHSGLPLWMLGKTITDTYEMSVFVTTRGISASRTGIAPGCSVQAIGISTGAMADGRRSDVMVIGSNAAAPPGSAERQAEFGPHGSSTGSPASCSADARS